MYNFEESGLVLKAFYSTKYVTYVIYLTLFALNPSCAFDSKIRRY